MLPVLGGDTSGVTLVVRLALLCLLWFLVCRLVVGLRLVRLLGYGFGFLRGCLRFCTAFKLIENLLQVLGVVGKIAQIKFDACHLLHSTYRVGCEGSDKRQ